jgi:hypothetical protein
VQVLPKPAADPAIVSAVNGALKRLFPNCDVGGNCPINEPMQSFLQRFAEEVRQGPEKMCAGIQNTPEGPVDEACVGLRAAPGVDRCDVCQGQHVFACKSGCTTGTVSWAPGSYARASDTWRRPPLPVAAAAAASALSRSALSDETPAVISNYKWGVDKRIKRGRRPAVPNPEPQP